LGYTVRSFLSKKGRKRERGGGRKEKGRKGKEKGKKKSGSFMPPSLYCLRPRGKAWDFLTLASWPCANRDSASQSLAIAGPERFPFQTRMWLLSP